MSQMPAEIELEQIVSLDTEVVGRNFELLREAYRQIHNDIHTKEWLYFTANGKKWRAGSDPDSENFFFQYLPSGDWQVQSNWVTAMTFATSATENVAALGTNSTIQGILRVWDGAGGNTPGYAVLGSPNGTLWYLFIEDDGTVKVHNAAPTANADGDAIGDQTD